MPIVALAEFIPKVMVYELVSTLVISKSWLRDVAAIHPPNPVEVALENETNLLYLPHVRHQ